MKAALLIIFASNLTNSAGAAEFNRWSTFKSPEAFVEAAKAFKPDTNPTDLSPYFTIRDLGQPEDAKEGNPVAAPSISNCTVVWSDNTHALLFATAEVPTWATRSKLGVLFLLACRHEQWQIDDLRQFTTLGKDAGVYVGLAAEAGAGLQLNSEDRLPVVTVVESQGGRGYSYEVHVSYTFHGSRLQRQEPE